MAKSAAPDEPEASAAKKIYVNYRDLSLTGNAVLDQALRRAGYESRLDLYVVDGAILLVDRAMLDSTESFDDAQWLLQRRQAGPFPAVVLLRDVSAAEVRASALGWLADLQLPSAPTWEERVAEAIQALDREFDLAVRPPDTGSPTYVTSRVIQADAAVAAVALGEVEGRPVVVTGLEDGTIRIWQLGNPASPAVVLRGHDGPVWSVAIREVGAAISRTRVGTGGSGRNTTIIVSGGQDHTVRVWLPTGEPIDTFTDHKAPVNSVAITNDLAAVSGSDDNSVTKWDLTLARASYWTQPHPDWVNGVASHSDMVVTACADRVVRTWRDSKPNQEFTGHTDSVSSVAIGHPIVFSGSLDGTVRGWNLDTGDQVHYFSAHPGGVRAVVAGTIDGVASVVSGGNDHLVRIVDLSSRISTPLAGHTAPVRSVAIGMLDEKPIIVSGSDDGTIRVWSTIPADHVEWLPDKPSDEDLLKRRPLARSVATRLRRRHKEDPRTSFLVHIDGPWGAGKSTLVNFLRDELERERPDKPGFTTIDFDAWREKGVGPAWWALLTALRTAIRNQRRWYARPGLRIIESIARLRRVGAPFVLALVLIVALGGGILWLFGLQDVAKAVTGSLAAVGTIWAGALVASRFLLWDSARGARLFEQSNSNPMLEVERHFAWLMAKSRKPVVFFIDDLDRCPDSYVVELLDTVQTLVRNTGTRHAAHFVVSADGAWIRTSYELAYERFSEAVATPGQPLGYLFLDKFFQLRVPVPAIDAVRQQNYLRELLSGPAVRRQELDEEEARVRAQIGRSVTEAQVVDAFRSASAEVRDRVAGTALDKLTTPEAIAATEHSLQRFAPLLPPNPRSMKRFVNAYSALRAVRLLEANAVRVESLALWTIIEIRWPSLADHLRVRPESISLLGQPVEELSAVPETLHPLFGDPALRLIVEFDRTTRFDADLIRLCSG